VRGERREEGGRMNKIFKGKPRGGKREKGKAKGEEVWDRERG